jgi:DNA-binding PadR family transcriptional regulator
MSDLSATAKVILGSLRSQPRSGYEIKQLVDRPIQFFWAASYSQIYPELRRLEEAGLIEGTAEATGDRARTTYRLTREGANVLRAWLREPPNTQELRHEGLLKVFFADALPPGERRQRLLDMRDQHLEKLKLLREFEASLPGKSPRGSPYLVLRYGIEFNTWAAAWCERAARDLVPDTKAKVPTTTEGRK